MSWISRFLVPIIIYRKPNMTYRHYMIFFYLWLQEKIYSVDLSAILQLFQTDILVRRFYDSFVKWHATPIGWIYFEKNINTKISLHQTTLKYYPPSKQRPSRKYFFFGCENLIVIFITLSSCIMGIITDFSNLSIYLSMSVHIRVFFLQECLWVSMCVCQFFSFVRTREELSNTQEVRSKISKLYPKWRTFLCDITLFFLIKLRKKIAQIILVL